MDLNHVNVVKSCSTVGECYGNDHVANRFTVSVEGVGIQILVMKEYLSKPFH